MVLSAWIGLLITNAAAGLKHSRPAKVFLFSSKTLCFVYNDQKILKNALIFLLNHLGQMGHAGHQPVMRFLNAQGARGTACCCDPS